MSVVWMIVAIVIAQAIVWNFEIVWPHAKSGRYRPAGAVGIFVLALTFSVVSGADAFAQAPRTWPADIRIWATGGLTGLLAVLAHTLIRNRIPELFEVRRWVSGPQRAAGPASDSSDGATAAQLSSTRSIQQATSAGMRRSVSVAR